MKVASWGVTLLVGLWSVLVFAPEMCTVDAISPADPQVVAVVQMLPVLRGCSGAAKYDVADNNSRAYIEYYCPRVRSRAEYAALKALFVDRFVNGGWRVVDDKIGSGRTAELQMVSGRKGIHLYWHPEQKARLGSSDTSDYHVVVTVRIRR